MSSVSVGIHHLHSIAMVPMWSFLLDLMDRQKE